MRISLTFLFDMTLIILDAVALIGLIVAAFYFLWAGKYELSLLAVIAHCVWSIDVRLKRSAGEL